MCRRGFSDMEKVLREVSDDRLRAYIVWLPIFGGDFQGESRKLSRRFPDKRVAYFTDPDSLTGNAWERVLNTGREMAWDVYFLYGAAAKWEGDPPLPDFWMHQLDGVAKASLLDTAKFTKQLKKMLSETPNEDTRQKIKGRAKMNIEFLYFKSCPAHKQAIANLKTALRESRIQATLKLIAVESPERAAEVGFQGSPSIRIDGKDLEGKNDGVSYSCRIYKIGGKMIGVPTKEYISEKLKQFQPIVTAR